MSVRVSQSVGVSKSIFALVIRGSGPDRAWSHRPREEILERFAGRPHRAHNERLASTPWTQELQFCDTLDTKVFQICDPPAPPRGPGARRAPCAQSAPLCFNVT